MIQYSAKFICGRSPGTAAAPGEYWTAVNVHNPGSTGVEFRKKFVVAPLEGTPPEETPPQILSASLGPDQAFEIDRREILGLFGQQFLKGFVVIESEKELDIVTVYTAAPEDGQVTTLDLERVPPRRVD
jgi:hypothetical protein